MPYHPVTLELFKHRFAAVADEMGAALVRTAFSANIKERRDCSCALFDRQGRMVAQAAHIPVHLGSMPLAVRAVLDALTLQPGDMAAVNDPFAGGTHLPDITIVAPVHDAAGQLLFYVANRAHHADIGGMAPGSMPLSCTLYQEGFIIPPLHIMRAGNMDATFTALLLRNVRTPEERRGDLSAQITANLTGTRRLLDLCASHGTRQVLDYADGLLAYTETATRAALSRIPDGTYRFRDQLDDDGYGTRDIPLEVALTIAGDHARIDFSQCADAVRGPLNAVRAITISACLYVIRCLLPTDVPANAGCLAPLDIITRPGSILDARFPAAVAGGNVETAQRVVDLLLGALAQALPDRIPAASQGTMNNLALGGADPPFAYYETVGGGAGAHPAGDGASAVHSHMTNTLNTPIEALEYSAPLLVRRYGIRRGSGGSGRYRGGDGIIREIEALAPVEATGLAERRRHAPWGRAGGRPGQPGCDTLLRNGAAERLPAKYHIFLEPGDRIRMETPGGGGFGTTEPA